MHIGMFLRVQIWVKNSSLKKITNESQLSITNSTYAASTRDLSGPRSHPKHELDPDCGTGSDQFLFMRLRPGRSCVHTFPSGPGSGLTFLNTQALHGPSKTSFSGLSLVQTYSSQRSAIVEISRPGSYRNRIKMIGPILNDSCKNSIKFGPAQQTLQKINIFLNLHYYTIKSLRVKPVKKNLIKTKSCLKWKNVIIRAK